MLKQGLEQTTQEENDFSMRVLLDFFPNNVLSFFSGNKKSLTRYSVAELKAMVDQKTPEEFLAFCKKNKPDLLETCETDGKSVLDHIHDTIYAEITNNEKKIAEYKKENADIIATATALRQEITPIKLEDSTRRTVPLFHSEELLDRLNIPKRPNIILTSEMLARAKKMMLPEINSSRPRVEFLKQLCALQEKHHQSDTTSCNNRNIEIIGQLTEKENNLSTLQEVQQGMKRYAVNISSFPENEKNPAKKLIDCLKEPAFQKACPWMNDYKPDESTFLQAVYPKWKDHADKISLIQESFQMDKPSEDEQTTFLRSCGFYKWQPERDRTKNITVSRPTI